MERKKNGVELTARKSRRECFVKCKFDRDRSSAIDSTHKKKSPFVLLYFACQEKKSGYKCKPFFVQKKPVKMLFFSFRSRGNI